MVGSEGGEDAYRIEQNDDDDAIVVVVVPR